VTQPPSTAERQHIVVVGAGTAGRSVADALVAAGFTDFVTLDDSREVVGSAFDDDTDTWLLTTRAGRLVRADVVVATHPSTYVPWVPNLFGRTDFRGASFPAAQWDPDFDPAGKHVAVIGTDTTAGSHIPVLTEAAASVTVFTHAPRRVVREVPLPTTRAKRWLRRHTWPAPPSRPAPTVVGSPIEAVISSGIRCDDGVEHRADVIVYGTGFAIADGFADDALLGAGGLTIRQAWQNGTEPFLGVAVRGFPNYFFITGPDIATHDIQARYVVECIALMKRTASTRIELRRSSQQVFNERAYLKPVEAHRPVSAFDLTSLSAADDEDHQTYDGAATLTVAGAQREVRVRLTGHLDPLDGRYHWQGTVFDELTGLDDGALKNSRVATLTVGERSAPARIVEQTPWGTHSVAGVGTPPYAGSGRRPYQHPAPTRIS
jgi:cation diffusion facilitator CzcD-associated flavoprotein CzcO